MLEIRNVSKTYRPKKGVPVKALDNVSIKFENTGMVFILGKSGSGKSTLLNVLGGLDKADSGEFIIKGKSSNDFTQSDFDSYRNTFIGFIFQEYNILPEFTVGANIALAMELQGKKATDEALNEILNEVDLTGYGNRKPNELSGGQKQRVAIARALIKQPEMIMADEPTGALDSNTGKQVFDTLKKLSKTKLVLIVSHDRDFAELYADRIIELKDGKIISDVSKSSVDPDAVSEGVSIIDDKIIRIKKGYKLTAKDLKLINGYLERGGDDDTLISLDGKKNPEIKKTLKINEAGGKDEFKDTRPEDVKLKDYTPEDSKLIRSRLPYKNSLKMGASSLKAKPGRLVFTILLSMVAFALFGLADTMSAYDKVTTYERSIIDSEIKTAAFMKQVAIGGDETWKDDELLTDDDIAEINKNSGVKVVPVFNGLQKYTTGVFFGKDIADQRALDSPNGSKFYDCLASGFTEITEADLKAAGCKIISGRMPSARGEIAITTYIYEHFKIGGLARTVIDGNGDPKTEKITVSKPDDILNKTITIGDNSEEYTVVGVVETNFDSTKFEDFKPSGKARTENLSDMFLINEMHSEILYGFHALIIVAPNTLGGIIENANSIGAKNKPVSGAQVNNYLYVEPNGAEYSYNANYVSTLSRLTDLGAIVWTNGEKTSLADNEVILPFYPDDNKLNGTMRESTKQLLINELSPYCADGDFDGMFGDALYKASNLSIVKYIGENGAEDLTAELKKELENYYEIISGESAPTLADNEWYLSLYRDWLTDYSENSGYKANKYGKSGYELQRDIYKKIYVNEGMAAATTCSLSYYNVKSYQSEEAENVSVVGYIFPSLDTVSKENPNIYLGNSVDMFIVSDGIFEKVTKADGVYKYALGVMPYSDHAAVNKIVKFNYDKHGDNGVYYTLKNNVSDMLEFVDGMVVTLAQVFLYVGIFFALFASLMMYNFISVSINYKKREIGILRAVGARSSDVFGIFFNESMIITLINFVLSSILTVGVVGAINGMLRNNYGFALTLLTVGIRQFALILGVGVLVAFIGSFLPVMRIARKRPIDAIQNR